MGIEELCTVRIQDGGRAQGQGLRGRSSGAEVPEAGRLFGVYGCL